MLSLAEIFRDSLPSVLDGFSFRQSQLDLAESITSVMKTGGTGVFEAGTGTGKTLSYLAPAFLSNDSVLISTGTKNLQDQLFHKDLPIIQSWFPGKRVALLKGRANYLCLRRLNINIRIKQKSATAESRLLEVRSWSAQTKTGDLTEVFDPEEQRELFALVTSTKDNCLGAKCPDYDQCALYRARDRASAADIVIVNHHLLFADLAQREAHISALLPEVSTVIVDEAHQVPGIARQFFGQRISSGQIGELMRDVEAELALLGNDDPACLSAVNGVGQSQLILRQRILGSDEQDFNRWYERENQTVVHEMDHALGDLADHLARVADRSEGMAQCARRALHFVDQFTLLTERNDLDPGMIHWINRSEKGFVIHLSPLSIADDIQRVIEQSRAAWIFTSATLSIDENFDHFSEEMGLEDFTSALLPSPFDYLSAVRAYIPNHLPQPGTDEHTIALMEQCLPLLSANSGRSFFLFTSHRALRLAAEQLRGFSRPVLAQGTRSKAGLLAEFRRLEGSVLLATQSFWEGVDVRGSGLRLLVIDKLPFPNPGDPVFDAQADVLRSNGLNPFVELALPRTVLSLKQGFGRLMRQEGDMGLFVLGDSRMHTRSYQSYVRGNLPEMQWLGNNEEAIEWLREIM
jgi:ATP-dependent DNA helicase DinG